MRIPSILSCGLAVSLLLLTGCASTRYSYPLSCTGQCINGAGALQYLRNGRVETGTFTQGLPTDTFQIQEADGRTISVAMQNGVPHGPARIRNATGQEYEQTYAFGFPVKGKTVYASGEVFDGTYKTMLTAKGPLTIPKEGVYTTAQGARLKGRFDLAADQLLFKGSLQMPGKSPANVQAVSPLPAGAAPYRFAMVSAAQFATLQDQSPKWTPAAATERSGDAFFDRHFTSQEYQAYNLERYRSGRQTNSNSMAGLMANQAAVPPNAATAQLAPATVAAAPQPAAGFQLIEGNTGRYLSPITSDGVAAGWVDKSINATMGSQVGGAAGAYLGQKALENVPIPFVGGFLGKKLGSSVGRNVALQAAGGEAYMRQTSDISFNDLNEMARWLVATHATHTKFAEIMKATYQIYPELKQAVMNAQYAKR